MIIDISCYPTKIVDLAWRHDGEPFTGERLLKMMDGPYYVNGKPRRIDKAFIQPPQGNTIYTDGYGDLTGKAAIRDYMSYTVELVQKYPDRFLGCFVYNPRYGTQNGAEEIEHHAKEYGFKMVQLQANMHAYRPDRALDWLRPAMRKCADLGLIVKVHTGDGPYSIPTEFYPIIREFPSVNFVLGHFGVQTGGVYVFEPFQMAMDAPNIYVESGWCLQSRIVEFAKELPKHKILFGTDTPPNEPGMWLRLLEVLCHEPPQGLNLDEDTLEDYLGNNIARMIGLDPTPPPRSVEEAQARLKGTHASLQPA
ncbi:amidohydrolase (plasmid) [Sinorhizobium meliloti WSM1022]|jgi:predicted TIM-barrel fold metal-dependent hydrolase|uniref:Amidohydrolase family protein n=1 Tax=Rhizobium meliloti TaxID=382 RepID=A0A7X1YZ21_RHIML|nr:amidohydrolase family protein [Sinorhizobium meliloti]ARS67802.1 amidohydrolase [Sinorhizobium meliloti RU11/001]ASJ62546.1 amidohydrolase [Sinorhizobium meliloti]ASP82015.1 amidohydrolase [Sinorhizobium meliloti]ASP89034.1 amidohydrolase [Sinorhizobium meliloti]ASQ00730.1 amidohydrolase [Sinorhizobium meliloti]